MLGAAAYPLSGKEDAKDRNHIILEENLDRAIQETPKNPMEFYAATMEQRLGASLSADPRVQILAGDAWALLASVREFRWTVSPGAEDVLPKIKIPCLLFIGEADPRFSTARDCAQLIPGSTFVSLPGLGHSTAFPRADSVLPHVKGFLDKVSKT